MILKRSKGVELVADNDIIADGDASVVQKRFEVKPFRLLLWWPT